jgi:hypothetical protein
MLLEESQSKGRVMKGRRERESVVLKGRERASGVEEESKKLMEAKPKSMPVGLDNGRDNYVTEVGTPHHRSRDPALWGRFAL